MIAECLVRTAARQPLGYEKLKLLDRSLILGQPTVLAGAGGPPCIQTARSATVPAASSAERIG
jgi:hypothetical protein